MQGLFCCSVLYGKLELVGARPLHLAAARPFCHLKAPLGLSLFCFAPQTRTCRGKAPPSCYARPFCRLKAPLGLSLFRFAPQTRTCRGKAPPSCCTRPFCHLKASLGLSLFRFAPQTRTCQGEALPSCCRKTVLSLKSPTGAFIVPLCSTNANLSGQSPSILLTQDRSVA